MVRFTLETSARARWWGPASRRRRAAALLHDVRDLVRNERIARARAGEISARRERDMVADGDRVLATAAREIASGVNADAADIAPVCRGQTRCVGRREWRAI